MPGDMLPFPPASEILSAGINSQMDGLLGQTFENGGKEYRLVQCNAALTTPGGRAVEWVSRANRTVQLTNGATDHVAGICDLNLGTTTADSYILVQILGRCEAYANEAITAGNYVISSTTGKLGDGGTTFTEDRDFGIAVDTAAADGDQITVDITKRLD